MADAPEEIADRLYAEPPDRFVAARDEAAADAKANGDVAAARQILKLRRPTIAAWLVNLLAIRRPDLIAQLADLATALRGAQRELRGADLRELSTQRRALVAALVAQARELAVEADPDADPNRLPLGEVETTLNSALSDVDVAAEVTSGRLLRAVAYAGFGEIPRPQLRLVTGGAGEQAPGKGGTAAEEEPSEPAVDLAALRRDLADARTGQKKAETELERAVAAEHDGAGLLAELEAQLAELERRRSAAEQELSRLRLARKAAERGAVAARRRFGEAQAAIEAADAGTAADAGKVEAAGKVGAAGKASAAKSDERDRAAANRAGRNRDDDAGRADRKRLGRAQSGG